MIEDNPYRVMGNESGWPDLLAMSTHSTGKLITATVSKLAQHLPADVPCDVLVGETTTECYVTARNNLRLCSKGRQQGGPA